jgi:cyclopropane-fatty-acyl-phospholipid synthase
VSTWERLGKPKKLNLVELGPGDGSLAKVLIYTFEKFPKFNKAIKIFLYEKSQLLKDVQRKKINNSRVKWIKNFNFINKGPVIFFGNEFFDAIPIKQFKRKNNLVFERFIKLDKKLNINQLFKEASPKDVKELNTFSALKKTSFIEFPKLGFLELKKIISKINKLSGGILLIDYGYLGKINKSTLQSVKSQKINKLFENIGDADVTSLVNFGLLKEYFQKNNLSVKNIVTQSFFLERLGIHKRAEILSQNMSFKKKADLFLRINRLIDQKLMGELFKVIFAFKAKSKNFVGFN